MAARMSSVAIAAERPVPTWNPFSVRGTVLPPNVLLMAKLLVVCFLLTGQWSLLPDHFLPFVPVFDHAASPAVFQGLLQFLFVVAGTSLLLNYHVRTCCLALGLLIFTGILSSRVYFENNRMFTGCLWFLAGVSVPGQKPWLIRSQVVLLYFGAALNKVLDADWRSGQFFENWVVRLVHHPTYIRISSWLPPMWLSRLMSWTTITTEFVLAAGFLVPRLVPLMIWVGIAYHTTLLLASGGTFGMFYFATLSSFLAFIEWPPCSTILVYAGEGARRRNVQRALRRLDLEDCWEWSTTPVIQQEPEVGERGLLSLQISVSGKAYEGLPALYAMMLCNPLTYFAFAILLSLPRSAHSLYRDVLAIILLLFVSPALLAPVASAQMPAGPPHRGRTSAA